MRHASPKQLELANSAVGVDGAGRPLLPSATGLPVANASVASPVVSVPPVVAMATVVAVAAVAVAAREGERGSGERNSEGEADHFAFHGLFVGGGGVSK